MSVTVAICVPFTLTAAPMIGSPSSADTTMPDTVFCATAIPIKTNRQEKIKHSFFLIDSYFLFAIWLFFYIQSAKIAIFPLKCKENAKKVNILLINTKNQIQILLIFNILRLSMQIC